METFAQALVNGLVIGGTYALMAVGLTLIFGYMDLVNFAHGELYMLGGFFGYTLIALAGLNFFLGLPLAIVGVMLLGYVVDRLLLKHIRGQGHMPGILITIGVGMVLQIGALLVWNPVPKRIGVPLEIAPVALGPVRIAGAHLLVAILAVVIILSAHLFMQKTVLGTSMRATFQDPDVAGLMGINVDRVYALTFAGGAGLAAAGGVLLGMVFLITPTMGELAVLKAFTVVILGGLGSFAGAVLGGLVVGIAESMGATYVASGYKDAIAFLLLLAILALRPQGLLGRAGGVEA